MHKAPICIRGAAGYPLVWRNKTLIRSTPEMLINARHHSWLLLDLVLYSWPYGSLKKRDRAYPRKATAFHGFEGFVFAAPAADL
jgi:hypothetical protein